MKSNERSVIGGNGSRWTRWAAALVLLGLAVESSSAWAQHRGWARPRVGVYIGGPLFWGYPYAAYPYSYYYPPPAYSYYPPSYYPPVAPASPPVYIERGDAQIAPAPQAQAGQSASAWYFCRNPEGYYPYVKDCPTPWEKVAPQPTQ